MNTTASLHPTTDQPTVRIAADRVIVTTLELTDGALARWLETIPEAERPGVASNALRIGLQAMANAGNSDRSDCRNSNA